MTRENWQYENVQPNGYVVMDGRKIGAVETSKNIKIINPYGRTSVVVNLGRNDKTKTVKGFTLQFNDVDEVIRIFKNLKP